MKANRLVFKELCHDFNSPEVTILLGARQVGKTYLLRELESYAQSLGKKTAYFNLELPSDLLQFKGSEEDLFRILTTSADIVFLDEFHYLKNASRIFKAVYDSGAKVKIFASGSSSLEIHKHLKESLAGRRLVRKIFPLSLQEHHTNQLSFEKVLVDGTLPGLLHKSASGDRQAYLRDLLETYVLKDIKSLIREENVKAFNHLLYLLAENQGSVVSVAGLSRDIGMNAGTVEKYLTLLEQTYVCYSLPSFSGNLANELKKSRKYFFYDLGIRNAVVKNFEYDLEKRDDRGVLYESLVFLELLQKVSPNTSLYFWRTRQQDEVDFVKVVNRKPVPVEVKSGWNKKILPDGLQRFLGAYPRTSEAYVVSNVPTGEKMNYQHTTVQFLHWKDAGKI